MNPTRRGFLTGLGATLLATTALQPALAPAVPKDFWVGYLPRDEGRAFLDDLVRFGSACTKQDSETGSYSRIPIEDVYCEVGVLEGVRFIT